MRIPLKWIVLGPPFHHFNLQITIKFKSPYLHHHHHLWVYHKLERSHKFNLHWLQNSPFQARNYEINPVITRWFLKNLHLQWLMWKIATCPACAARRISRRTSPACRAAAPASLPRPLPRPRGAPGKRGENAGKRTEIMGKTRSFGWRIGRNHGISSGKLIRSYWKLAIDSWLTY